VPTVYSAAREPQRSGSASYHSMHCPEIGAACSHQIDRGRQRPSGDGTAVNSALPKASALDPQPVLGGVGDVSDRLYGILMIA
jgi:hypothetical protein